MNPTDFNEDGSFGKEQIMSRASYGVTNQLSENVILTTLDDLYDWARLSSLWPADKILPIDVYIPGCPPRPEAIIDAIIKLRKKIANDSMQERNKITQTHRFYSTTHNMKVGERILTGEYLRSPSRDKPPSALAQAMGTPIPPALQTIKELERSND